MARYRVAPQSRTGASPSGSRLERVVRRAVWPDGGSSLGRSPDRRMRRRIARHLERQCAVPWQDARAIRLRYRPGGFTVDGPTFRFTVVPLALGGGALSAGLPVAGPRTNGSDWLLDNNPDRPPLHRRVHTVAAQFVRRGLPRRPRVRTRSRAVRCTRRATARASPSNNDADPDPVLDPPGAPECEAGACPSTRLKGDRVGGAGAEPGGTS
jgi:hypothetical protein